MSPYSWKLCWRGGGWRWHKFILISVPKNVPESFLVILPKSLLFRYKKKILELAKQHDKASEIEKVQRYQMPSDKGELQTYLEEDNKEKVNS